MKKILFSIIAVVVCVAAMGSAFAYFTDVELSDSNIMGAGTLDLIIRDNNEVYSEDGVSASFNSPSNTKPGDMFDTSPILLKNAGTIDIYWVFARFTNLVDSTGISNYFILRKAWESLDGGANYTEQVFDETTSNIFLKYWNDRGATLPLDGAISLYDLWVARNFGSGDYVTSLLLLNGATAGNPSIPVGHTAAVKFTFQLAPQTPNSCNGASATFDVKFIATQEYTLPDVNYPDSLLGDYVNPADLN